MPSDAKLSGTSCDLGGRERRVVRPRHGHAVAAAPLPGRRAATIWSHDMPSGAKLSGTSCDLGGRERQVVRPRHATAPSRAAPRTTTDGRRGASW
ncbi:hypothetical protein ACTJKO_03165, partial [Curtobacterium sp. 22159]|uniref:hypothetical protein n=1 Tax=Curtobacterium sp. 22159 TaxID=3453882 RepID=UPI003F872179